MAVPNDTLTADDSLRLFPPSMLARRNAKDFGAYYTDEQVADFLVRWAIRSPGDVVLDPCFGGGVFLRSACARLRSMGNGAPGIRGVEIDARACELASGELAAEFGADRRQLLTADFFAVGCDRLGPVDAVIGNPPFVRYQRFSGAARETALKQAEREGVRLTRLASSWAPFVIHAASFLRPAGRMALVIPMEICHAGYALPVLRFLAQTFASVTFLTFRRKLFPRLNEDTLLLLAENKGGGPSEFILLDLPDANALGEFTGECMAPNIGQARIDSDAICAGSQRLTEYLLPERTRCLCRELMRSAHTRRLGDLADVGIGYVTGCNSFFHLSPADAVRWRIPNDLLRPALLKSAALRGLSFTSADWSEAASRGTAGHLLDVPNDSRGLPKAVHRYLEFGREKGVHNAYKCRTRTPWFSVPHVHVPHGFLTYMSGAFPRFVTNEAGAVATNNLHIVRLLNGVAFGIRELAVLWQTSLTSLSAEIEGHPLGGGMLKLEPSEAESVLIAAPELGRGQLGELARELDALLRAGQASDARSVADKAVLENCLGIGERERRLLREGADCLRERRYHRGDK